MIYNVFTVFDGAISLYLPPFFMRSSQEAIRAVADCLLDPDHAFSKHPADYTLFELGTYVESTAEFQLLATPIRVCTVQSLVRSEVNA